MERDARDLETLRRAMSTWVDDTLAGRPDQDRRQVRARFLAQAARRPATRRGLLVAAAVAAGVLLVAGLLLGRREAPLRLQVDGVTRTAGAWIAAPPGAPVPLRFGDGTRLDLAPGGRARVAAVDARGARLVLEGGRLHLRVAHRAGARWTVEAGPYRVHVTGTAFTVEWQPVLALFELSMEEGAVRVEGALLGSGRRLVSGQTLRADGPARLELLDARTPSPSASLAGARVDAGGSRAEAVAPVVPAEPVAARVTSRRAALPPDAGPSWEQLDQAHRYPEALARARTDGLEAWCTRATAAQLLRLGDVARYAGDPAAAGRTLQCVRRRFAGSDDAAAATFMLGRVAFDGQHDAAAAAQWFGRYVQDAPSGPLVDEAWGRWMESLERAGHHVEAARVARDYLQRPQRGAYAGRARRIAGDMR